MVSILGRSGSLSFKAVSRVVTRSLLFGTLIYLITVSPISPRRDFSEGLAVVSRQAAFSIVKWEAGAFLEKAIVAPSRSVTIPADIGDQVQLVRDHYVNVAEIQRRRAERDRLFSEQHTDQTALDEIESQVRLGELSFDRSRNQVEAIIAGQIESSLHDAGIRPGFFEFGGGGWPIPFLRIYPNPFFSFQKLPQNLLIAPRERIAIIGSVLVSSDLSSRAIEDLESRTDRLGVASLVSGIGGLGTYPSMIPDTEPLRRGLDVIAHEWAHHYLAFRPLGRTFFTNYEMRAVNELVADIVGEEIGKRTFETYYQSTEPAPPPDTPAAPRLRSTTPRPDFGREMRRIRVEVERLLALNDIEGAERYMQAQRAVMTELGWNIRRLNTAYLSFFGAYSGGANRQEPPLRDLRQRAGDLSTFLRQIEQVTSIEQLATFR